jgi:hypothetical protein
VLDHIKVDSTLEIQRIRPTGECFVSFSVYRQDLVAYAVVGKAAEDMNASTGSAAELRPVDKRVLDGAVTIKSSSNETHGKRQHQAGRSSPGGMSL